MRPAFLFDERSRGLAGEPAEIERDQEARAGEIAPVRGPREPARRAAAGEQIGEARTVLAQYARLAVDLQAALGVEQRAGDLGADERRLQGRRDAEVAAEGTQRLGCGEPFDL